MCSTSLGIIVRKCSLVDFYRFCRVHFAIWWLVPEQRHIVMMDLSPQALCECARSGEYKNEMWQILFSIVYP